MEIINQQYEIVPIARLKQHPRNPRKGNVDAIAESIEHNGFYGAVVAQRSTGYVLAGNHRLKAAGAKRGATVPVVWVDVDDERALRILLADNRTNDLAGYDDGELVKLLGELPTLDGTGYDQAALDELMARVNPAASGLTDEDAAPAVEEAAVTKPGDVWILGNHRIICGDSTDADVVGRLLGNVKPHLMVTDPPYGVDYDPDWRNRADRANGKPYGARAIGLVSNDDKVDWSAAFRLFPGDVAYCWHAGRFASQVQQSLEACGFEIRCQIIWAKNNFAISRGHYHWQHEPCWYAVKNNGHWVGDRSQTTLWKIDKPQKSETGHSTQKPVECMRKPMENNSSVGQAVYEPFSGSGTSIIAAEQIGRCCYAVELKPQYVDVAVKRWQDFTGKRAVLEATGEHFPVTNQGEPEEK